MAPLACQPDRRAELMAAPFASAALALASDRSPLLASLRDGVWLDAQEFPPLAYTVPGLIPEGSVLLVGPPKAGKSWLVLAVGLATAEGGNALGIDVPQRPVFYLALEDGHRRLQDRCRKLLAGDPIPAGLEYLTVLEHGRVVDTIADWLKVHDGDAPPLVILDTLGKVMPPALPGESSYQRDYRIGTALKRLCDDHPGMTLLTNHHDRKAVSDDFVDSVSGTHGLAGAADTIMVLCRDRQETSGLLKVTGRDIPEGEYAVVFRDGCSWQLDGDDLGGAAKRAQTVRATTRAAAGLGPQAIDIILYAHANPDGVTPDQVAKALELEPKVAQVYLARAVTAGRLARPQRGLYTPVGSVGSVGSEQQSLPLSNTPNTPNTPAEEKEGEQRDR
jgi:hypothetical protein